MCTSRSQPERRQLLTNQDVIADMRDVPHIKSRLLMVAAFAIPAFVLINGCKSTATQAVTAPAKVATDDAALAAKVKQALVADPGLRSLPISVATYRGVVQLSGYVDAEVQIEQALAVTRGVAGVQSVSNDLHLRPQ
ncbi:BON domain-containing protein [Paraburkholderia sp. BL6665CI2N2]|nr:BON domain-containing protein [Paraburkholderia sp. BL6665CI2N2]